MRRRCYIDALLFLNLRTPPVTANKKTVWISQSFRKYVSPISPDSHLLPDCRYVVKETQRYVSKNPVPLPDTAEPPILPEIVAVPFI